MNFENKYNSEIISEILCEKFINRKETRVLDICCGAFDDSGTRYDLDGKIYQPIVAQVLAQLGFEVTGLDVRGNTIATGYKHQNNIDITKNNWHQKLEKNWDCLIFLRSWDTPEILLYFQKILDINNLNLLSLEIAKIYLPIFAELLTPNSLFFTTDICNFGLCEDAFERDLYQNQITQLLIQNGFKMIFQKNGLWCFDYFSKRD